MKNIYFLFVGLIGLSLFGSCHPRTQVEASNQQILRLKDGCLIFRLQNDEKTITKLTELGYTKKAEQKRQQTLEKNKAIVDAFKTKYNFNQVYFIYQTESRKVIDGNLAEVNFLNRNLEIDPTIKPECEDFITGQYGHLTSENTNLLQRKQLGIETEGTISQSYTNIEAIVLLSDKFLQLSSPFPYYSRKFFLFKFPFPKVVSKLNDRLKQFYNYNAQSNTTNDTKE